MKSNELQKIYLELLNNNLFIISDINIQVNISNHAVYLINKKVWNMEDQQSADWILRISNNIYNNSSVDVLILDDGIYDQLLQLYKHYNPNYQIGAEPMIYDEAPQNEIEEAKIMAVGLSNNEWGKLYVNDIHKQYAPRDPRLTTMAIKLRDPISKRLINTKHSYPELVGTLDKCKFVLNAQAIEKNVFDTPSVQIFERDFIQKHLMMGVINPTEEFEMVGELKYDGISVEAEVRGDTIISACSRGDTGEDVATDLTPILGGYKFRNATGKVDPAETFGIKFEAIITKYDLDRLSMIRGKSYKNARNAIIGLFGSSDAYKFVDMITLIPLSTSLDIPRETELMFLNKYYSSGQYNRYVVFKGNYQQILFQVKQFVESAEIIRKILPYLIDGVVVSYTDPNKIKALGRVNSVNKYSIAIKFNPKKVRTIFLGFTFEIGKTGEVTPMVHFKPCEFMGNIRTKQTLHSYKRFNELQLRIGNQIDIEFKNDVLSYISKPDNEYNRNMDAKTKPEEFIKTCPYCGSKILISPSGKSAKCPNQKCPERIVNKITDMMSYLGFVNFSEKSVRALNIKSLKDLLSMTYDRASILGPINAQNLMDRINYIKSYKIEDYKIMAALCFDNIGIEKWKLILHELTINDIINLDYNTLYNKLITIRGIGEETANLICTDRKVYIDDLIAASQMNIINSKGAKKKPKIAFTGDRDQTFISMLNNLGFDANDKHSVTKDTYCLIANDKNSKSSKITKAQKYNIPIYTKQEFIELNNIKL